MKDDICGGVRPHNAWGAMPGFGNGVPCLAGEGSVNELGTEKGQEGGGQDGGRGARRNLPPIITPRQLAGCPRVQIKRRTGSMCPLQRGGATRYTAARTGRPKV